MNTAPITASFCQTLRFRIALGCLWLFSELERLFQHYLMRVGPHPHALYARVRARAALCACRRATRGGGHQQSVFFSALALRPLPFASHPQRTATPRFRSARWGSGCNGVVSNVSAIPDESRRPALSRIPIPESRLFREQRTANSERRFTATAAA